MRKDYVEADLGDETAGAKFAAIKRNEGKEVLLCDGHEGWNHGNISSYKPIGEYSLEVKSGEILWLSSHDLEALLILGTKE